MLSFIFSLFSKFRSNRKWILYPKAVLVVHVDKVKYIKQLVLKEYFINVYLNHDIVMVNDKFHCTITIITMDQFVE